MEMVKGLHTLESMTCSSPISFSHILTQHYHLCCHVMHLCIVLEPGQSMSRWTKVGCIALDFVATTCPKIKVNKKLNIHWLTVFLVSFVVFYHLVSH